VDNLMPPLPLARTARFSRRALARLSSLAAVVQIAVGFTVQPLLFSFASAARASVAVLVLAATRIVVVVGVSFRAMGFVDIAIPSRKILSAGNWFKVCGIYTRLGSAQMVEVKADWNWSNDQQVRQPVGENLGSLGTCNSATHSKFAVAGVHLPSQPNPASVRPIFVHPTPQPFVEGFRQRPLWSQHLLEFVKVHFGFPAVNRATQLV
jgi:hypothetical protein